MTDLSLIIPCNYAGDLLDALYGNRYESRSRLGLSEVGHECSRYLWYKSQGVIGIKPDNRILRLFELGNIVESHIIADMVECGFIFEDQQTRIRFEDNGLKLYGHSDGTFTGPPPFTKMHLLEIKTAGEKAFAQLRKLRYEAWNPKYKAQIHCYMLGLGINRCLVIVYNKNTSAIYSERIRLNKEYAAGILKNAFNAISQTKPPLRICPRADWFKAKWCDYYKECFKSA